MRRVSSLLVLVRMCYYKPCRSISQECKRPRVIAIVVVLFSQGANDGGKYVRRMTGLLWCPFLSSCCLAMVQLQHLDFERMNAFY